MLISSRDTWSSKGSWSNDMPMRMTTAVTQGFGRSFACFCCNNKGSWVSSSCSSLQICAGNVQPGPILLGREILMGLRA